LKAYYIFNEGMSGGNKKGESDKKLVRKRKKLSRDN
jgi:hypothetical protein